VAHPLGRAGWEVGQDQGKGADEHARQLVDDRELLEDGSVVLEGGQEGHVAIADAGGVFHKQVGKAIRERPASLNHYCSLGRPGFRFIISQGSFSEDPPPTPRPETK